LKKHREIDQKECPTTKVAGQVGEED